MKPVPAGAPVFEGKKLEPDACRNCDLPKRAHAEPELACPEESFYWAEAKP